MTYSNRLDPTDAERKLILAASAAAAIDQSWVPAWEAGAPPTDEESLAWIRARPIPVRELMLRFPPSCLVIATVRLMIPARGTKGIVTSLFEDGMRVTVRQGPMTQVKAECSVNELVVVGYHRGMTPEWVAKVLEGH